MPYGPREALYDDLYTECLEGMEEGDQLIIGIDANEDIRTGATANLFHALGMNEAILHKHSESSPPLPITGINGDNRLMAYL